MIFKKKKKKLMWFLKLLLKFRFITVKFRLNSNFKRHVNLK
jgi:hypothetical protein